MGPLVSWRRLGVNEWMNGTVMKRGGGGVVGGGAEGRRMFRVVVERIHWRTILFLMGLSQCRWLEKRQIAESFLGVEESKH